jgi:hypothetical protein
MLSPPFYIKDELIRIKRYKRGADKSDGLNDKVLFLSFNMFFISSMRILLAFTPQYLHKLMFL